MLPSTEITTTLVGNTLGISSRDVGILCTSDNINYFSKYKPVKLQADSIDRNANPNWYKATNGNCGINVPNGVTYSNSESNQDRANKII